MARSSALSEGQERGIDISAAPGIRGFRRRQWHGRAITRDVDQVPIIVIRHDGNLMTVYAGLDDVTVSKGKGQPGPSWARPAVRASSISRSRQGSTASIPEKYLRLIRPRWALTRRALTPGGDPGCGTGAAPQPLFWPSPDPAGKLGSGTLQARPVRAACPGIIPVRTSGAGSARSRGGSSAEDCG